MLTQTKTSQDWQTLTELTRGKEVVIERVRLKETNVSIEGSFELPELAKVNFEDQIFIAAFIRAHGSIKEMEQIFGVSYPTIKARLNRIAESLEFVETNPRPSRSEILARLERGEITAEKAVEELEALR